MKMGHGKDNDDHKDESQENKDNDKEDDKGESFKMNRPNLILRQKFYGVDVRGPGFYTKSCGSMRLWLHK